MKRQTFHSLTFLPLFSISFLVIVASAAPRNQTGHTTSTTQTQPTDSLSVTRHQITLNGNPLPYTAAAGFLPLQDDSGKLEANLFHVAYTLGHGPADPARPLTFFFNGGPGAAAVWLHVGGLGPWRVEMDCDGTVLPDKTRLAPNDATWLDLSDLVFVDPVGTGYSRAAPGADPRKYYEVREDIGAAARFIRLYITQHRRWLSPLFITGESYGATRAAGLVRRLQSDFGIYPRGVILISAVLDFQALSPGGLNDLPYALALPTCVAAAHFHKKLSPALQQADLQKTLSEVETWAVGDYLKALAQGDALPDAERDAVAAKLADFTGLPLATILRNRLRISASKFARELLRDDGRLLGFMDARVAGVATSRASEWEPYDPAFFLAIGPFTAAFNDYVRRELHFESPLNYEWLNRDASRAWKWSADGRFVSMNDDLREAMAADTRLRVFNAAGIYDLTTPYFAQRHTLDHLGLEPALRPHLTFRQYPSGHQLYTSQAALRALTRDVTAFYRNDSMIE